MTAPERASSAQPTGSVKRTLFAWLLLPLLVIVPAGAAVQYWFSARPAIAAFDHALGDTALALANLVRIDDWLCGRPPGQTYHSPLAQLVSHPLLRRDAA